MSPLIHFAAAVICGALSGVGIGGGTLLLVYMTALASLPQTAAQGINLLYFIPTSLAALFFHIKNGLVDKKAFIPTALSGLLSALLTSHAANSIDPDRLRSVFGMFLIAAGTVMFFKKVKK